MICNHCGKEVESVTSFVAELHNQGMTATEIRDELQASGRIRAIRSPAISYVYSVLRKLGLSANKKARL